VRHFRRKAQKGFVLNKTNSNTIAHLYSPETDNWIGEKVVIGPRDVDYQGQLIMSIRVIPRNPSPIGPNDGQATKKPTGTSKQNATAEANAPSR
jgi:hypothetical protein